MQQFEQLEHGQFYHIYNHAVGESDLFRDTNNYEYFLELYDKHISPVAETYAWVLMKNHFHILVRIRNVEECLDLTGFENLSGLKPLYQYFSNLFNAYTKAYNKYHQTRGALFERPFKRKLIDSDEYLQQVVLYIHNNPVHHGFCGHPLEYPWSSYLTCTSIKPTKLKRDSVIEWFDDRSNFIDAHELKIEKEEIERWLEM
jgi:REP element-mobilizing transposase RayT